MELLAAGSERRDEAEHRGGPDRDEQCEGDDRRVHPNALYVANRSWAQGREILNSCGREQQPKHGSREGQEETLAEQVAHKTPSGRAEGCPDGELAMPAARACEREVREVGARDEQKYAHGAEEKQQWRASLTVQP